jgi:hypothetical protein
LAALGPSLGIWIYGLPGSRLGLRRSAGAPALESLARGAHDGENWRAWIFYGPPDQALAELADQGSSPEPEGGALLAWQQTMELAVQVKRQGQDRLQLVNLGHSTPALEAALGPAKSTGLAWRPKSLTPVEGDAVGTLLKLIDALEDDDDVQTVWGNYDVSDEVMAKLG